MSNKVANISDVFKSELLSQKFEKIAPKNINLEAEKTYALQILRNNNYLENVAKAQPNSLLSAITNVAAIGLSLNPAKKQAYLIPRNVKVRDQNGHDNWVSRVYLEPSYMGLCDVATLSGSIKWVQAKIVRKNDEYENTGVDTAPLHKVKTFGDRGDIVGVYCVAKTKDNDFLTTEMDMQKLFNIRDRSESWKKKPNSGPWHTDFEEMAKKTVIRNSYKTWPKTESDRMDLAVHLSNENEGLDFNRNTAPEIGYTDDQKKCLDQFIENGDALGMFVFKSTFVNGDATSAGAQIWTSLCGSFDKGNKGKYAEIIRNLVNQGESLMFDIVETLQNAIGENDSFMFSETFNDLSHDEKICAENMIKPEYIIDFNKMKHELKVCGDGK